MPIPDDVLERILATANEVVDIPDLHAFVLGVGRHAEAEGAALGGDAVVTLFRSDDAEEAAEVFDYLNAQLAAHPLRRAMGDVVASGLVVYVALYGEPPA